MRSVNMDSATNQEERKQNGMVIVATKNGSKTKRLSTININTALAQAHSCSSIVFRPNLMRHSWTLPMWCAALFSPWNAAIRIRWETSAKFSWWPFSNLMAFSQWLFASAAVAIVIDGGISRIIISTHRKNGAWQRFPHDPDRIDSCILQRIRDRMTVITRFTHGNYLNIEFVAINRRKSFN